MMNDMYWGKMMYANNKMKKNSEVETLTEEQHEVLAELCAIRHEFHCLDTMKVFRAEIDTEIDDWFDSEHEGNIYEKLEQKLQQYEEYLQATENNDISISEQSVDNETLEKWYADKKLMFFTHEAGEYINNLKKEFPDCIIVDNETQALDGVKADITVAMTKCMSHKLFFKQKSYAVATGAEIVYYNQRNIDNLKPVIYKQIFKK